MSYSGCEATSNNAFTIIIDSLEPANEREISKNANQQKRRKITYKTGFISQPKALCIDSKKSGQKEAKIAAPYDKRTNKNLE
ncbi:hypothetical protein NC652_029618 [Populus alba x Populus x berolinensis]|nr:hypothetical protein NC652_029618 [Populus alba x Populus x berolinensis]